MRWTSKLRLHLNLRNFFNFGVSTLNWLPTNSYHCQHLEKSEFKLKQKKIPQTITVGRVSFWEAEQRQIIRITKKQIGLRCHTWDKINVSIARVKKGIWKNAPYKPFDKINQEKLIKTNWKLKLPKLIKTN